jgi:uncharacterized protein
MHFGIESVYVMTGFECNLRCRYCMQACLPKLPAPEPNLEMTVDFLRDVAENQDDPVLIQFFGGEPMLHFEDVIKPVVHGLQDLGQKIRFGMTTNGTLFTRENVDYINAHFSGVAVSWDGKAVKTTRGVDVFAEHPILYDLDRLGIVGVFSGYASHMDFFESCRPVYERYRKRHGEGCGVKMDDLLDFHLADRSLFAFSCGQILRDMTTLAQESRKMLLGEEGDEYLGRIGMSYVNALHHGLGAFYDTDAYTKGMALCKNGYAVLNLDLQGNLYRCHNVRIKVGTIRDSYMHILDRVIATDVSRELMQTCKDCPVAAICQGGCTLIGKEAREAYYCAMRRAEFLPFVEMALDLGESLHQKRMEMVEPAA